MKRCKAAAYGSATEWRKGAARGSVSPHMSTTSTASVETPSTATHQRHHPQLVGHMHAARHDTVDPTATNHENGGAMDEAEVKGTLAGRGASSISERGGGESGDRS
jgi:hypothetical protein